MTGSSIERQDFDPLQGWLFLEDFKRIEAPGLQPYPATVAVQRLLHALALTPAGERPAAPTGPEPTESAEDLLARGKALSAQNKYAEAVPLFERATQLAPRSFEAWANLGRAYNETGQHGPDLEAYEHALALDAQQAWVWSNKGKALRDLKRNEEALPAYDRALALDPISPPPGTIRAPRSMTSSGMRRPSPPTTGPSPSTRRPLSPGTARALRSMTSSGPRRR